MDNWYAWVVEQSLDDQTLFTLVPTWKMKSDQPDWKEHILEVSEQRLDLVVDLLRTHLQPGWYAHLVKDDRMKIIFRDRVFEVKRGDDDEEVLDFAKAEGISQEQLPITQELFDQAKEEGLTE